MYRLPPRRVQQSGNTAITGPIAPDRTRRSNRSGTDSSKGFQFRWDGPDPMNPTRSTNTGNRLADVASLFVLSGNGDVIERDGDIAAIGSGGSYALAAARALARHTDMGAEDIARSAMGVAAEICIFTNDSLTVEVI